MNLIDSFKEFYARRQLNKELVNQLRAKKMVDFDQARNVGVLYNITDEDTYKVIFDFLKSIRNEQRTVIAIGFLNEKTLPSYLNQSIYNSIICQKDLNWYNKPVNQYVNNFFKESFDIFLNISLEEYYPLLYISAITRAHLKVGTYSEKYSDCFDLMIKKDEKMAQTDLIESMIYYLHMFNTPAT